MSYTLNPKDFIHETDRKAMESLKAVPGFDKFVKFYLKHFDERAMKILNLSSKLKLSPEQCPRIYNLLVPVCNKLNIEVPELYLELNRDPNAYTSGDTYIYITVTTGLLDQMTDDEIQSVLAHECGHIVCHHVLYRSMGTILLNGAGILLGTGLPELLKIPFAYWMRCSELSADRVASIYTNGPDRVIDVMLRLIGGGKAYSEEINKELFMQQAAEFKEYTENSKWNKTLEYFILYNYSHPFLAVRALEINEWCKTEQFKKIQESLWGPRLLEGWGICPYCHAQIHPDWVFCKKCGKPLNKNGRELCH